LPQQDNTAQQCTYTLVLNGKRVRESSVRAVQNSVTIHREITEISKAGAKETIDTTPWE